MVDYAEAAIDCGDPAFAAPLFEILAPWSDQLPATGASALGPVSHYLGGLATVLGRHDEADGYFAHASALSHRIGAKFFPARSDVLWGQMLARRGAPGDLEAARRHLQKAQAAGHTHGYGAVERRATDALATLA